jgi:hypothetical protein
MFAGVNVDMLVSSPLLSFAIVSASGVCRTKAMGVKTISRSNVGKLFP